MKNRKYIVLMLIGTFLFTFFARISIFAHDYVLNVNYDSCVAETILSDGHYETLVEEGLDETWYCLTSNTFLKHIPDEINTIKYYFADSSGNYTWTTDVSEEVAKEIKNAFVNSMKKWNNIYCYSYSEDGTKSVRKIIDIVEGSKDDYNIIIYPAILDAIASTNIKDDGVYNPDIEDYSEVGVHHKHYDKWVMYVNVRSFYKDNELVESVAERTGAHEMGHVLGLFDVDVECNFPLNDNHHQELLMGYGDNASTDPAYKDIAGVSITRGFHTDADHIWMLRTNDSGTKDVICALCNGVRFDIETDLEVIDGTYYYEYKEVSIYGSCNGEHTIVGNNNMLLVATDTVRDFYKCLCCKYIAEVVHDAHEYTEWKNYSTTKHIEVCSLCGQTGTITSAHVAKTTGALIGKGVCIYCGAPLDLYNNGFPSIMSITKYSINGSYILPNGIIVLVDEDIEAYENGTLVFYDKNNLPQAQ